MNKLSIKTATKHDITEICDLFKTTIKTVNSNHYSNNEIHAWAQGSENIPNWENRIDKHYFILAKNGDKLVGMASCIKDYLDVIYVHHKNQGQGIATTLLNNTIRHVQDNGYDKLFSDVSITAKPYFLKKGFSIIRPQLVYCRGVYLRNYHVVKHLDEIK